MTANRAEQKGGGGMSLAVRINALADQVDDVGIRDTEDNIERRDNAVSGLRTLAAEVEGYVMVPVETARRGGLVVNTTVKFLRENEETARDCGDANTAFIARYQAQVLEKLLTFLKR